MFIKNEFRYWYLWQIFIVRISLLLYFIAVSYSLIDLVNEIANRDPDKFEIAYNVEDAERIFSQGKMRLSSIINGRVQKQSPDPLITFQPLKLLN